jgi:hypothetical protein
MGQLATTIAGGVIGFAIGGPFGAQVGMMLGGMIGATLFGPTVHGPRLNDLKVTASTYGVAIPEIYGTVRLGGNLIWTSGIRENRKSSRPGKGGPKQVTYSYDATFAMSLCKGEIEEILRIWADSKIIYDKTGGTTRTPTPAGGSSVFQTIIVELLSSKKKKKNVNLRFYRGDENQLPDSLIEAKEGVGNVSGHRGLAYVVFERLELENFGNRIPQMTFEVTKARTRGLSALPVRDRSGLVEDTSNRDWLPDFASGRLLSFDRAGNGVKLYTSADNTLVAENEAMTFDLTDKSYSLVEGQNSLIVANFPSGVGFSYYNTAILTKINEYNSSSGTDNVWDPATQQITLSTAGKIGHGRFVSGSSGSLHILHSDAAGKTFLMDSGGRLLDEFTAPFQPDVFLEGRRDATNSQIIGWRFANDRLEMFEVKTKASALYTTILEGANEVWFPTTEYEMRVINLKPYPDSKFQPLVLLYDPTDDHFFCLGVDPDKYNDTGAFGNGGGVVVFKYSLATNSYKFLVSHPGTPVPRDLAQNMRVSRLAGSSFGWVGKPAVGSPTVNQVSLQTGSLENLFEAQDDFGSGLTGGGDQYWDDETDSIFAERTVAGVTNSYRIRLSDSVSQVTVPEIVADICLRSGVLLPQDIDITELESRQLVGYSLDRLTTARDALKQLATAFLFDAFESDYKLKFRSRGGDSVVNITEDWLARDGQDGIIKETITQELEMPLKVTVNYYDIDRDHQQGSQSSRRNSGPFPTMWTAKEDLIDLPITWDADSAKQSADKLLKMAWANRIGHQFSLPWRYLQYDPTDVATITLENETTYNLRLTEANIGSNFSIEATAVSEVATAYVSTATGAKSPAPIQTLPDDGSAFPIVINTPLLRDVDYDTTGSSTCYFSAGTNEVSFNGAAVYIDDGSDYQVVGIIDGQTTTGYVIDALLPTNSYEATDETTIIRVRLTDPTMELESVTQNDILNFEANSALVGNEIIQFRDATLLPTGEWALSGILRARRGTNYAVMDHQPGETFLLVNTTSTGKFTRPPESYFTTRLFKAAPISVSLSDVVPVSVVLTPRDLMPYTPEAVKVTDDGTGAVISAERRSRVTAGLRDGVGTIHYREGDMLSARIVTKVWFGKGIADVGTIGEPDVTSTNYLFDAAGQDIPIEASFPVASLGAEDTILIKLAEIGEVEGTPKWVQAIRYGTDLWDLRELY